MSMKSLRKFAPNLGLSVATACCFVLIACDRTPTQKGTGTWIAKDVTEQELAGIFKEGMSSQELTSVLGEAVWEQARTDGVVDRVYFWGVPSAETARVESVGGVSVQLSNNLLISWRVIHTRTEPPIGSVGGHLRAGQSPVSSGESVSTTDGKLAFYIVSEQPMTRGVFVDTETLPKLGYIRDSPDLEVKRLQAVSTEVYPLVDLTGGDADPQRAGKPVTRVSIVLTAQDAKLFSALTVENVGKRILIAFEHEPLAAPLVTQPIEAGNVQISIPDTSAAEEIARRMRRLVNPG